MFEGIKNSIFERKLKKEIAATASSRQMQNKRFDELNSILFFFDCTSEEKYLEFEKIYKKYKQQIKDIRAIGYTSMKQLAHYHVNRINTEYVLTSDYNAFNIPKTSWMKEVINRDFDALIDLSRCVHKSFQWLIALSQSKCKIGAGNTVCQNLYDISIDTKDDHSQEYLMEQTVHYLNILKK